MAGKPLSAAQQANLIRRAFPDAQNRFLRGQLLCRVSLQPTRLSAIYTIEILYRPGSRPSVRVARPALQLRPGASELPHTYDGRELCLNLPGEWTADMSIADSTLPWTAEWLLHYEIWLACGEWTGGGVHAAKNPDAPQPELALKASPKMPRQSRTLSSRSCSL